MSLWLTSLNSSSSGGGVLALTLTTWAAEPELELKLEKLSYQTAHDLIQLPVSTAQAKLNEFKDTVEEEGTLHNKIQFALAETCVYLEENSGTPYEQRKAKFLEYLKEFNIDESTKGALHLIRQCYLLLGHPWWVHIKDKADNQAQAGAAIAQYQKGDDDGVRYQYIQLLGIITEFEKLLTPEYLNNGGWRAQATRMCFSDENYNPAKGAEIYFEGISKGLYNPIDAKALLTLAISYEITKDGYNPADLKTKLSKAILVYKIRARQFKPAKEGDPNPAIEFVGMLQDAVNDIK